MANGAAAGLTRLMESQLFGVSPLDPLTHLAVALALLAAAGKVRQEHRISRITFRASLVAVQAVTICLAATSISNLALLSSIQG